IERAQLSDVRVGERRAAAVPRREQAAVLGPREHPGDRAQRREKSLGLRPPRGTRADVEQPELVDRRERAEELDEARVVDERAVGAARALGELLEQSRVGIEPGRGGGEQRRRERGLEVSVREPREAVLERDRLSLLGQLQPPGGHALRLREDRVEGRAAAASGAAAAAVEDGQLAAAPSRDLDERDE